MNTYKVPWFCVIQPNLLENTRPIPSPYIIPTMQSPVKLTVFLLYLELFNRTGEPRIKSTYVLPIVEVKVIFFSYQKTCFKTLTKYKEKDCIFGGHLFSFLVFVFYYGFSDQEKIGGGRPRICKQF